MKESEHTIMMLPSCSGVRRLPNHNSATMRYTFQHIRRSLRGTETPKAKLLLRRLILPLNNSHTTTQPPKNRLSISKSINTLQMFMDALVSGHPLSETRYGCHDRRVSTDFVYNHLHHVLLHSLPNNINVFAVSGCSSTGRDKQ